MNSHFNIWFYLPFALLLTAGGMAMFFFEKGDEVLFINSFHAPFFDYLFSYGTTLGHGLLYLTAAIVLAWKNFRNALIALLCLAATGGLVQLLKRTVFSDVVRPKALLADEPLHFVEGVKIFLNHSFPSGHSATAFSLFCLLSLIVRDKKWGLLFIFMAMIGGVSRIYLVQHFFIDVYFGALIGVTLTSLIWWWFMKTNALHQLDGKSLNSLKSKI